MKLVFQLFLLVLFSSVSFAETKVAFVYPFSFETHFIESNPKGPSQEFINKIDKNNKLKYWYLNYNYSLDETVSIKRIKNINERITAWAPSIIISDGPLLFEYFLIKMIYPSNFKKSFFYNIDECSFQFFYQKYSLNTIDNNVINGVLAECSFNDLCSFAQKRDIPIEHIYVFKNSGKRYDFIEQKINAGFSKFNVEFFIMDDETALEKTLSELHKKPQGIILVINTVLRSSNYEEEYEKINDIERLYLTERDIAKIFFRKNHKHLEIFIGKDLTRYGFAVSLSTFKLPSNNEHFPVFDKFYFSSSSVIKKIKFKKSINIERINELKLNSILNDLTYFDKIIREKP